jgi:hypothetical protein
MDVTIKLIVKGQVIEMTPAEAQELATVLRTVGAVPRAPELTPIPALLDRKIGDPHRYDQKLGDAQRISSSVAASSGFGQLQN